MDLVSTLNFKYHLNLLFQGRNTWTKDTSSPLCLHFIHFFQECIKKSTINSYEWCKTSQQNHCTINTVVLPMWLLSHKAWSVSPQFLEAHAQEKFGRQMVKYAWLILVTEHVIQPPTGIIHIHIIYRNWDSSINILTRLWAGWPGFDFWQGREFSSSPLWPDSMWAPSSLLSNGYWGLFPWGYSSWGVKLTTW
jgi:hypothetical protein